MRPSKWMVELVPWVSRSTSEPHIAVNQAGAECASQQVDPLIYTLTHPFRRSLIFDSIPLKHDS